MSFDKNDRDGIIKNVLTAYSIILLHILLLFCAGVVVLIFKGLYSYLAWIMAGIGLALLGLGFALYRRLNTGSSDIRSILSTPGFENRTVEVRLLGGLASFKITPGENSLPYLEQPPAPLATAQTLLSETTPDLTEQKLLKLMSLYAKDLITEEEFERAKQKILQG